MKTQGVDENARGGVMDEYGSFRDTPADYAEIDAALREAGSVVFSWSKDQASAYVVGIAERFKKLGVMPFGGNPVGSAMFSILWRGSSWISLNDGTNEIHPNYVAEKFRLVEDGEDAESIATLINGLRAARYLARKL